MQRGGIEGSPRIAVVDIARGAALVAMALYHLSWDLAYFHLAPPDLPVTPLMRIFSHTVAGAFLTLAGVSLALAHRDRPHWPAFFGRLGIVGGAAAVVTAATYLFAPQETIFFGILHCIAAASLLAAPLLRAPPWIALALGALAFAAPLIVATSAFESPALIWLGLGTTPPNTLDWRPLTPWSGCVLFGLGLTRLNLPRLMGSPLARWAPASRASHALAWAGRHSLMIYLVHQPILFAFLLAATSVTGAGARWETEEFTKVCLHECIVGGGEPQTCAPACACVVRGLRQAGLTRALARESLDDVQQEQYSRVVRACSANP